MSVTLHTTTGDIKIELFCEDCPKACENFLALCASDYYKDNIFHRNIKDFMVQTGDPSGSGKGGNSIWGVPFEDELNPDLKHNARGILSMANNGPNTNKSQFFITYAKQPHLDLKYTIFGKVIDGFDALDELENIKVDAKYRPVIEQSYSSVKFFSSSSLTPEQRIKQMQEYFNQYVEEYYEDSTKEELEFKPAKEVQETTLSSLDDIYNFLNEEKAADIVVLELGKDGPTFFTTLIICSPFNPRHGFAMADALRKSARLSDEAVSKRSVRNGFGWFQVAIGSIQVHVMSADLRARYDLEGLWGAGDVDEVNEDGIDLLPPKAS